MERQERVELSPRARKLISKAAILGVEPTDLRMEIRRNIDMAIERGSERVTRGDLGELAKEVRTRLNKRVLDQVL